MEQKTVFILKVVTGFVIMFMEERRKNIYPRLNDGYRPAHLRVGRMCHIQVDRWAGRAAAMRRPVRVCVCMGE